MKTVSKKFGISAAVLKWIAVVTMIIDHFAVAVYPQFASYEYSVYYIMRKIGRLAFPIYCFLLVEGFFHTKNVKKYFRNCFLFAILSEIPFNMAIFGQVFYSRGQNVYFTLCIGLATLIILDRRKRYPKSKYMLLQIFIIVLAASIGQILDVDYHWKGVLFIVMFYYVRNMQEWIRNLVGICAFAYEGTAPLAFLPIHFYNGTRGRQMKYLFYAIYPIHLLILGLIRLYWY
ncbi:MAG: TraX family protein [Lachnospiraceae bacterium]|nr:TraX family protein [Lachnospiraceae bacterium]